MPPRRPAAPSEPAAGREAADAGPAPFGSSSWRTLGGLTAWTGIAAGLGGTLLLGFVVGQGNTLMLPQALVGGIALLMLAGLSGAVSLWQRRRDLDLLGGIAEGMRRLAGGDATVRLPCDTPGDGGALAGGFNHMAERLGDQVQTLHVLAAIDRDIIRRASPEEVAQHILAQFVATHAGARAVIAWVDETPAPTLQIFASDPTGPAANRLPPVILSPEYFALFRSQNADMAMRRETVPDHLAPPWVAPILHPDVRQLAIFCVPFAAALSAEANQQGQAVAARRNRALLCIGLPRERTHLLRPMLRQAEALRDRLAVAYAGRERDDLLLYRALHDSLTGLTNRQGLHEYMDALLVSDPQTPRAVLCVELNGLRHINDGLGRIAGDELLYEAARRLSMLAPAGAVVARPGGGEFVMLLAQADEIGAREMAQQIRVRLAEPYRLLSGDHVIGASVGMALAPQHGKRRVDLLQHADKALSAARPARAETPV